MLASDDRNSGRNGNIAPFFARSLRLRWEQWLRFCVLNCAAIDERKPIENIMFSIKLKERLCSAQVV
jgi:hypothetical protein